MRWKAKSDSILILGDIRICSKFLWLPFLLEDEWRWLEVADWEEKVIKRIYNSGRRHNSNRPPGTEPSYYLEWMPTKWLED